MILVRSFSFPSACLLLSILKVKPFISSAIISTSPPKSLTIAGTLYANDLNKTNGEFSHQIEGTAVISISLKIFDTFQNGTDNLKSCLQNVELIKGSFLNQEDVSSALRGVEILFHYASLTNPVTAVLNPVYDIETNILGSVKLIQAAIENSIERIVFPSSGGTIYGNNFRHAFRETDNLFPFNPYAISKLTIERYLEFFYRKYGMKYYVLRYSNPYGERQNPTGKQGVIPVFLNKILHNEQPVIVGNGTAVRDYIYIKDAISATIAVLESETEETTFNVGSGQGTSLLELLEIMRYVSVKAINPSFNVDDSDYISKIILDIAKIKKETGWAPSICLNIGIKNTWEWIVNDYSLPRREKA